VTQHRILQLQRSNRRAPAKRSEESPNSHVHQEEEHRPIVRTAQRGRESGFPRPTGPTYAVDYTNTAVTLRTGGTTAVAVYDLAARRGPAGTLISWRASAAAHLLGFNLYRDRGHTPLKLNHRLLPLRQTLRAERYSLLDRGAPLAHVRYRLQLVHTNGRSHWLTTSLACNNDCGSRFRR
jgi:hypothetical protein